MDPATTAVLCMHIVDFLQTFIYLEVAATHYGAKGNGVNYAIGGAMVQAILFYGGEAVGAVR